MHARSPSSSSKLRVLGLSASLLLGGCVTSVELGEGRRLAEPPPLAELTTTATLDEDPSPPSQPSSVGEAPKREPKREPKPSKPRRERGPTNPEFIAWHYAGGVAGTMVLSTMSYAIARHVGTMGQGLGPAIGALLIGAFAPPLLNYTVQWALGRTVAPGRDRFWPGFLVRQFVHLGMFAGAVLGGADFNKPGHLAAMVVGEAFVTSGLATMTAELSRRPLPASSSASAAGLPSTPRPIEIIVPIVELRF